LNYQAIGSANGQTQAINGTVDFGASDVPVASRTLAEHDLLQFPTVLGAVVAVVNIPGIKADQLKLTGEVLADIYLGRITKWNDPRLVDLNPGLPLPNLVISPVFRADGSGTTFLFTSYLSTVSQDWSAHVGASASVAWVTGHGTRGNDGMAATVKLARGSVGYVESAYATHSHLATAQIRNRAGRFVAPSLTAFVAAGVDATWTGAPNYLLNLIDTADPNAWPIVSATFVLVPKTPKDTARTLNVLRFFDFAFTNGASAVRSLEYVTLPTAVQEAIRATWRAEIHAPDGTSIYDVRNTPEASRSDRVADYR
jgi:phosphate transport system substrate-binding protein